MKKQRNQRTAEAVVELCEALLLTAMLTIVGILHLS